MASTANCSKKFSSDNGGKRKSKKLPSCLSLTTNSNLCHLIHSGWESITISASQEYIPWEILFYQPYLQYVKTKLPRDKCAPNQTQKHLDQPFRKWLYSSLVTTNIRCSLLQCTNEYTEGKKNCVPSKWQCERTRHKGAKEKILALEGVTWSTEKVMCREVSCGLVSSMINSVAAANTKRVNCCQLSVHMPAHPVNRSYRELKISTEINQLCKPLSLWP